MLTATEYDDLHSKLDFHQYSPFVLSALDQLNKNWSNKKILEVGCGQGGHAKFFQNPHSLGIDISKIAIAKAKVNFPNKNFKVANILTEQLDEVFDYVIDSKLINCLDMHAIDIYLDKIKQHNYFVAEIAIHPVSFMMLSQRYFYSLAEMEQSLKKYFKYYKISLIRDYLFHSPGMIQQLPVYVVIASNKSSL
jgi:SAM-dependent methyltransferase